MISIFPVRVKGIDDLFFSVSNQIFLWHRLCIYDCKTKK